MVALQACEQGATVGAGAAPVGATPTASPRAVSSAAPTPAPVVTASPSVAPSVPTASPSPAALKITSDTVFASLGSQGVGAFATSGVPIATYATTTGADEIAMDANANTYVLSSAGFAVNVSRFAIGAASPNASYLPTSPRPQAIFAGPNGTLVVAGPSSDNNGNPTGVYDFWDPGTTGAPSRTFTYPIETLGLLNGAIARDGTFYLPYSSSTGQVAYDVIPPGSATPSRTIVESIASPNTDFSTSAMAVGADGTLYVGEWTYVAGDANAGRYVYPPTGTETRITQGASNPTGIGFDSASNVYVCNSNATIGPDSNLTTDTLHELSIFSPAAHALTGTVVSGLDDPQDLAVDDDGTAYAVDDANADQSASTIDVVRPGATAATVFANVADATNVVLFDGSRVRSLRASMSGARAAASAHARRFHVRSVDSLELKVKD